jgi:hypothetical protein
LSFSNFEAEVRAPFWGGLAFSIGRFADGRILKPF